MPKGQKVSKTELAFPRVKGEDVLAELKKTKISAETMRIFRDALKKKTKVEKVSVPVRMKLDAGIVKELNLYVQMAVDEKKVSKNEGQAKGEILSFALVKFLKSDRYFQAKVKK